MGDKEVLGILRHSLGLNPDGAGCAYRNCFVAGTGHDDLPVIDRAVRDGLMVRGKTPKFCDENDLTFHVTDAGRAAVLEASPPEPKLTRSQRRYRQWRDAGAVMPFGEWIRRRYYEPDKLTSEWL